MEKIALLAPKNRINFISFSLFVSKIQNEHNFKIYYYNNDYKEVLSNIKEDYILIIKKYCYINFNNLIKLISKKQDKDLFAVVDKKNEISSEVILVKTKLIEELYKIPTNKIFKLNKSCYLSNVGLTEGEFHKSIFVCFDDNDPNFFDWLESYHTKTKTVFFNNQNFNLTIGKNFFIKGDKHIGILPDKSVIYWNKKKLKWIKLRKLQKLLDRRT
jgi:hypothetical protein